MFLVPSNQNKALTEPKDILAAIARGVGARIALIAQLERSRSFSRLRFGSLRMEKFSWSIFDLDASLEPRFSRVSKAGRKTPGMLSLLKDILLGALKDIA